MPEAVTTPDVAALQARIVTLEQVARSNKDHAGWLTDAYTDHEITITSRDNEIARLRDLNRNALAANRDLLGKLDLIARDAEAAHDSAGGLRTKIDYLHQDAERMRDLIGRIHRFGTIPEALQTEAGNWIPDEWKTP